MYIFVLILSTDFNLKPILEAAVTARAAEPIGVSLLIEARGVSFLSNAPENHDIFKGSDTYL